MRDLKSLRGCVSDAARDPGISPWCEQRNGSSKRLASGIGRCLDGGVAALCLAQEPVAAMVMAMQIGQEACACGREPGRSPCRSAVTRAETAGFVRRAP